jgi:hypothetical protein
MEEYIHRRWFIFGVVCTGLTGLLCGLLIGFQYGYTRGKEAFVSGSAVRVDTVRDTVRVTEPRAADSVVTGVIRVPVVLPMADPSEPDVPKAEIKVFEPDSLAALMGGALKDTERDGADGRKKADGRKATDGRNGAEAKRGEGGSEAQKRGKFARKDTAWITVPRTQKRYEDSTYTAWVSGYEARLDSIHVYRRTVTRTIAVPETALKGGARNWLHEHFGAGLVGGAGYGLTTKRADVFVGVGGWIRIF